MSVYGGKITTFRKLSQQALHKLKPYLESWGADWTAGAFLPGGDIPDMDMHAYIRSLQAAYEKLDPALLDRLARSYGTNCHKILGQAQVATELGEHFGADLYQAEVEYLLRHEWAKDCDDILLRRTKLGLTGDTALRRNLDSWLGRRKKSAA